MKKQRLYSAWIIPYGKGTKQVQSVVWASNKKEAREKLGKYNTIVKEVCLHTNPTWASAFYNA